MTSLADIFDIYSLRARIYPALLTVLPGTIAIYSLIPLPSLTKLWPLAVSTGVTFFAATFVRGRGLRAERRLIREWGGMPTTLALRLDSTALNPVLRDRRRAKLERLCGFALPTREEEDTDTRAANDRYQTAIKILIIKVREDSDKFPLVQAENIGYGFRRNLYSLKAISLTFVSGLALIEIIWLITRGPSPGLIISLTSCAVAAATWILVVNSGWVYQIGERYAERLLDTLEHPMLNGDAQQP